MILSSFNKAKSGMQKKLVYETCEVGIEPTNTSNYPKTIHKKIISSV